MGSSWEPVYKWKVFMQYLLTPLAAPSLRLPHHKLQKGARLDRQIKGYSI